MIDKGKIESHLNDILEGSGIFMVYVKVDQNMRITVHLDRMEGISIDDCVRVSRELESRLDREEEDFALEVSSPGLDSAFMVIQQYEKYLGKKISVHSGEGGESTGILRELKPDGFILEIPAKKGSGEAMIKEYRFDGIKSARLHIEF
jgi:ribosome maturation factor RimP